MKKQFRIYDILFVSVVAGLLEYLYNLLLTDGRSLYLFSPIYISMVLFLFVGLFLFFSFKMEIFRNWFIFTLIISGFHSSLVNMWYGFNFGEWIISFLFFVVISMVSIKVVDYVYRRK